MARGTLRAVVTQGWTQDTRPGPKSTVILAYFSIYHFFPVLTF